jgi:dTDP-4-dehydrorhamnose reductase
MRILVTGADGQLGRCLQDLLNQTPYTWIACNRASLDITDALAVNLKINDFKPDVIINAAAYTAVDKAESDAKAAWAINAHAVGYLATAANLVGARLLHVSTDYVFDGSASSPYKESDPVCPLGVYGASKLAGEQAAATANRFCVVRTAWVFSEYGNNFLKTMLRLAASRTELSVVADQIGTPTYAGNLAATLIAMAEKETPSTVYHYSGGRSCSWQAFAETIFDVAEKELTSFTAPTVHPIGTIDYPTPAKRPAYSVLDDSLLRNVLPNAVGDWGHALPYVIERISSQK